MKVWIYLFLVLSPLLFQACSTCQELRTPTPYTEYGDFELTIMDPDGQKAVLEIRPFNAIQAGTFQLTEGFTHPLKPFPQNSVSFHFFFRRDSLPNGEDIFEQKKGEVFDIPSTPYEVDGIDVIYDEAFPDSDPDGIGWWLPTTYSGKVTILEDDLVEFDLTFTDGVESRRVLATFVFKMLDLVQEVGECG